MSRNLLPKLRDFPNPANIPQAKVGAWTRVGTPAGLAQLDYGAEGATEVRARVQSIPNPWARLLLFKNAMEDPHHPARRLIENEILDALQFLWSVGTMAGSEPEYKKLVIEDLEAAAEASGSQRVEEFARALVELLPRNRSGGRGETAALTSLVMVLQDDKPVMGESPFTILFTAEDASSAGTGSFFRYAAGDNGMKLVERPFDFQRYVAQVLLPQFAQSHAGASSGNWVALQRTIKPWLEKEVHECVQRARGPEQKEKLRSPNEGQWQAVAFELGLEQVPQGMGGLTLFRQRSGARIRASRWRLRVGRNHDGLAPIVLDTASFDGKYFDGAPNVNLPRSLEGLDREVLPGLDLRHPWIDPASDFFTDRLLLLQAPLNHPAVYGFKPDRFTISYRGDNGRLKEGQLALPLRAEVFRYFTPEAVDEILRVDVQASGRVEVSLTLQVGGDDEVKSIVVRKSYDSASIAGFVGPTVALWPAFSDDRWRDYLIFREDAHGDSASHLSIIPWARGSELSTGVERRSGQVQLMHCESAPDVIEIRSTFTGIGSKAERLGVVLPRWKSPLPPGPIERNVGVDFGTSNTIVSIRDGGKQAPEIFGTKNSLLTLSSLSNNTQRLLDAFFFPQELDAGPFGTAVVQFRRLPNLHFQQSRLGLHVNVPFKGHVENDDENAVVGDLKWSAEPNTSYLTESFLRHVLSTVLVDALANGVDPAKLRISWSYPRAFTRSQVEQLRNLWKNVLDAFKSRGLAVNRDLREIDESRAALQHFFDAAQAHPSGRPTVIVDVGGGTDLAIYGNSQAYVLDSVMMGGRNLTGPRMQGATRSGLSNPYVHAFVRWAESRQLDRYPIEHAAVTKYLRDGQDHLAFTYLVGTDWFREQGHYFSGHPDFHRFQGVVLYFFGALFHYVGLSVREVSLRTGSATELPHQVMLAGNGSRYANWLTDLSADAPLSSFSEMLSRVLAAAAQASDGAQLPRIVRSKVPKQEVALGLVVRVTQPVGEDAVSTSPLIGESLRLRTGSAMSHPAERFRSDDVITADDVASIDWAEGEMEIERFHRSFLSLSGPIKSHGPQWPNTLQWLQSQVNGLRRSDLQQDTKGRLAWLAAANKGYRSSVFILEAATVIDSLLKDVGGVEGGGLGTDRPRPAGLVAT
jgi:hypothetical protein